MHQPPRNTDVDWIMIDAKHVIIGLQNRIKELEGISNQSHGANPRCLELKTGINVRVTPNEVDKLINNIDGPECGHVHQITASKAYAWVRLDRNGEDKVFAVDQLTILDEF